MFEVIKQAVWLKQGKAVHFKSYVKAENILQATKYAAKQYGLDNIKEINEIK